MLPLGGSTICDRWLDIFSKLSSRAPIVITNQAHFAEYEKALRGRTVVLHNDGATNNDNRLGAVADLQLACSLPSAAGASVFVVVAGDTLLDPSVDVAQLLTAFVADQSAQAATVGYHMKNPDVECRSRGIMLLQGTETRRIAKFLEKPKTLPAAANLCLASAPLYFYKRTAIDELHRFVAAKKAEKAPAPTYDAPGYLLEHLVSTLHVNCYSIPARVDIGNLEDYIHALQLMHNPKQTQEGEVVVGRCLPRVGCLGNPSDGYKGACVSFPVEFLDAEAAVEARAFVRKSDTLVILPNRLRDRFSFSSWNDLNAKIQNEGYYGGNRLIQATLRKFFLVVGHERMSKLSNVTIGYASSIPFSVGLAGSSAIVVSAIFLT